MGEPAATVPPQTLLEIVALRARHELERAALIPRPRENILLQGSETRDDSACSTRNHLKSSCNVLFKCGTSFPTTSG